MRPFQASALAAALLISQPAASFFEPPSFEEAATRIFATADTDGDGLVDRKEIVAAVSRYGAEVRRGYERDWSLLVLMVGAMPDATRLDPSDTGRGALRLHSKADTDGDGAAGLDEIRAFLRSLPPNEAAAAAYLLAGVDANADGTIDADELDELRKQIETFLDTRTADEDDDTLLFDRASCTTMLGLQADAVAEHVRERFELLAGAGLDASLPVLKSTNVKPFDLAWVGRGRP